MNSKPDGGPAFPFVIPWEKEATGPRQVVGMTLRDYFAAAALPYAAQFAEDEESHQYPTPQRVAEYSYQLADAMLAERNK